MKLGAYPPILTALRSNPGYVLMRGLARFAWVRDLVAFLKRVMSRKQTEQYLRDLQIKMPQTIFPDVDPEAFVVKLRASGLGFGLKLPNQVVEEIVNFAAASPVYAFRNPKWGFEPRAIKSAESALGREILLAQYFNSQARCPAIDRLAADPTLRSIALKYLGCAPQYLGAVLWWTYPVTPNRADQMQHAHFFHRDIDDFKFLKFFFYLTDVEPGDGGHWAVSGSHKRAPHVELKDRFITRRFEDEEIQGFYDRREILEICGEKGVGFAEDTLCVHKGATPVKKPRLILQLQFGLFGFVPENDLRAPSELARIPNLSMQQAELRY